MAAKRFSIETPEQLKELAEFAREQSNSLMNKARIWSATKRRKGQTPWDKAFFVMFSGTRNREAAVVHFTTREELEQVPVRYNKALNWCELHLREVIE